LGIIQKVFGQDFPDILGFDKRKLRPGGNPFDSQSRKIGKGRFVYTLATRGVTTTAL
jgi:hypothetical protein